MKYDYLDEIVKDHKEEFQEMFEKFNRKEISDKEWFSYCQSLLGTIFNHSDYEKKFTRFT
jgi:hypothetical protein